MSESEGQNDSKTTDSSEGLLKENDAIAQDVAAPDLESTPTVEISSVEESFGAWLRGCRESQKVSLEEIAAVTKIHINQLKNLEQDRFEQLPATAFVRGFLVNYARHIGLDESQVLTRFQEAVMGKKQFSQLIVPAGNKSALSASRPKVRVVTAPDFEKAPTTQDMETETRFYNSYKFWMAVVSFGAIVSLIVFLVSIGKNSPAPEAPLTSSAPIANDAPVSEAKVPETAVVGPEMGPALPPSTSASPAASPSLVVAPKPEVSPSPLPRNTKSAVSEVAQKAQAAVTEGVVGANRLEIKAIEQSWVNVRLDEKESQGMLMETNKSYAFGANKRVVLSLSNAGAIEIRWNGKWYSAPGFRGDVKSLTLPDQLESLTAK